MHVQIETVAELAHETDGTVMPPWSEAPEWMQKSSVEMVTAMYKDPSLPASHFHDVWMKQRTDAGWKWGHLLERKRNGSVSSDLLVTGYAVYKRITSFSKYILRK